MSLFQSSFAELAKFLRSDSIAKNTRTYRADAGSQWPKGGDQNFVFKQDTAFELGNPKTDSISFLIWTDQPGAINNNQISLIGPNLDNNIETSLPFGQIILLQVDVSEFENDYQIFRYLEDIKYGLNLQGYMRRGAPQFMREWSRISRKAVDRGFNLKTLGNGLIELYLEQKPIAAAEVILVSDSKVFNGLYPVANRIFRIIKAMNKMIQEESLDCDDCDFQDICGELEELKAMRKQKREFIHERK